MVHLMGSATAKPHITLQDARQALFAGSGYVPDIPSLQAWLECAWQAGFDPQGAEQLGGKVQGTRKWVGTTEAAALLRYFGVRARVVDFGTQQQQEEQQQLAVPASGTNSDSSGSLQEVHPNVECDGCGRVPIIGARYRSQVLPDYDLCERCYEGQRQGPAAPFARMMASRVQQGSRPQQEQHQEGSGGRKHQRLMQWVWDYFTSPAAQQPEQPADEAGAGPSAALEHQQQQRQPEKERPSKVEAQSAAVNDAQDGSELAGGHSEQAGMEPPQHQQLGSVLANARSGGWTTAAPFPGPAGPGSEASKRQRVMLGDGSALQQPLPGSQRQHQASHGSSTFGDGTLRQQQLPWCRQAAIGAADAVQPGSKGSTVALADPPEYTLLVLDPGCPTQPLAEALYRRSGWQRMVKRGQHTLRKPQYQLLWCDPGLAATDSGEYEALKVIAASERY
ncbi:hypothetical protein N2152v2_008221 [Parachlorella kessleri]